LGSTAAITVDGSSADNVVGKFGMDEAGVVDLVRTWVNEGRADPVCGRLLERGPGAGMVDTLELRADLRKVSGGLIISKSPSKPASASSSASSMLSPLGSELCSISGPNPMDCAAASLSRSRSSTSSSRRGAQISMTPGKITGVAGDCLEDFRLLRNLKFRASDA